MIDFIKDADCTKETPVRLGVPDTPIYGKGIKLKPRVDGRTDSEHFKKIYLPELLPLEEYDLIVVLISGGKDSVACYLKLLELGVPKERIEFWHHDIDGGHPSRRMDWKCTQNYVKALADAEGIKLRVSYRVNGFFGELYRIGASEPIEWIDPDTGEVRQCKLSSNYLKCKELKEQATEEMEELLKKYGYRMKFPAKTGDLSRRWCSAYLKICVADTVVSNLDRLGELEELGGKRHKFPAKGGTHSGRWCSGNLKAAVQDSVTANLEETKRDKKILIVSGERRGESAGRSKYNEMEIHRTNAEAKAHRIVHQWRCCIDYSEKDVWELLKRHHINPHPCYRIGWNKKTPVEQTINQCDDLIMFQKIVKLSDKYDWVEHEHCTPLVSHIGKRTIKTVYEYPDKDKYTYKSYRVFASNDQKDGRLLKRKQVKAKGEKFGNTPDHCFIFNDSVVGVKTPPELDRQWYIDLAKKRLKQFGVVA